MKGSIFAGSDSIEFTKKFTDTPAKSIKTFSDFSRKKLRKKKIIIIVVKKENKV